ncbi:hypothetical protein ASPVEDRAFT_373088 [Aspergillus versicolor CBS 583.65]|uniref:FAD-binding domain-containing protein n=1 Tax=Aspergillus versicolor CBS 583.65 TaxID=1036611 RepID=A0A1L9Q1V7_ASPVE|nr:uncharacterized protein ASPVEDRAFT_373088 [Aspergillus versicolor CBS 583.65]OJJ07696.1 hypothetical protein ASPVEDRAFT_373088 [Aspergillus versicolor CBS 583.65]
MRGHPYRIAGLTLAQALRRHRIPCTIFERDDSPEVRHQGWGVSIHSTLTTWEAHVLPEIYDRVCEAQVNPAVGRDEVRGVPWINGATGQVEQFVPKGKRLRLRWDGIRRALMEGLDIKWGKRLDNLEEFEGGVRAGFADGTAMLGTALVGADGSMSIVRKFLAPTSYKLHRLPINALGCTVMMSEEQVNYFKDHVDPLYFMGTHPETDTFVFWSLLDTPTAPGRLYRAQLYFSWMASDADEGLLSQPLLEVFKQKGRPFFPRMRDIVDSLPDDTVVTRVNLVDWPSVEWDNWNGTCTLIGDGAHCMVIYRGEGVNHAIVDACQLADTIKSAVDGHMSMNAAVREYEKQMHPRAREAVQTSRQAGHDGHCYSKVDKEGSFALLGEKPV